MKKPRIKRMLVLPLVLLFVLVAGGFGKKSVELREKGLIDLSRAISTAGFGVTEEGEGTESPEADEDGSKEQAESGEGTEFEAVSYSRLRIRGTQLYLDGQSVNMAALKTKLEERAKEGRTVQLIDAYADEQVYREALELLAELREDTGLEYEEFEEA